MGKERGALGLGPHQARVHLRTQEGAGPGGSAALSGGTGTDVAQAALPPLERRANEGPQGILVSSSSRVPRGQGGFHATRLTSRTVPSAACPQALGWAEGPPQCPRAGARPGGGRDSEAPVWGAKSKGLPRGLGIENKITGECNVYKNQNECPKSVMATMSNFAAGAGSASEW